MSVFYERQIKALTEKLEQCGVENRTFKIYIQQLKEEIKRLKAQTK